MFDQDIELNAHFPPETDFAKNIEDRTNYILEKCPKIKLLVNIGSNVVSLGKDDTTYIDQNGLISKKSNQVSSHPSKGLIDTFLNKSVKVLQVLNIKGIALEYGIPYAPIAIPKIGSCLAYVEEKYSITIPVTALGVSVGSLIFYYFYFRNRKESK